MLNLIELGNNLYIARRNKNLKQSDVCKILKMGQSTYSKIENGKYDLSVATLFELATLFEVTIEWLLGLNKDEDYTSEELKLIEDYKKLIIKARK